MASASNQFTYRSKESRSRLGLRSLNSIVAIVPLIVFLHTHLVSTQVSRHNSDRKPIEAQPVSFQSLIDFNAGTQHTDNQSTTISQKQRCTKHYDRKFETTRIACDEANLAEIFVALQNKNANAVPIIDELVIRAIPSTRIFGSLLHGKAIRSLSILSSNVSEISEEVFSGPTFINTIKYLNLEANSFGSVPRVITHFSSLNNLTTLSLAKNQILSIPADAFKPFVNITLLDMSHNQISTLHANSFVGLASLEVILLNNNQLKEFPSTLFRPIAKRLRTLDFGHNLFSKLGPNMFNELSELKVLNISNNLLTSVPRSALARVSQLMHLNLGANQLTSLDANLVRGVRFLSSLNLTSNRISNLARGALKSVTRIKSIDLSNNTLAEITADVFHSLQWLQELNLKSNNITLIRSGAFSHLFQFSLDLEYNNISVFEPRAFTSCANITTLALSGNSINAITAIAFGNNAADEEVSDVTDLDLSYNSLFSLANLTVISTLSGLKLLNLSHNGISGVLDRRSSGFAQSQNRLHEVHTIDLNHNQLTEIKDHIFERYASVRLINLTCNSLERIGSSSFGALPTLLTLDLSYNSIESVSSGALVQLISLRTLYLNENHLKRVFAGMPFSLSHLDLRGNEIAEVPPGIFPEINSLLRLHLERNNLTEIVAGALRNLRSLQFISLADNRLTQVPREALKDCSYSLQNITLTRNRISSIGRAAFGALPIVFHVELQENEITDLRALAFDGLLQLISLNMSHNRIGPKLANDVFHGLVSLQQLDLSHNEIIHLTESSGRNQNSNPSTSPFEPLLSVHNIDLSHNHISFLNDLSFPKSPWIPYKLTLVNLLGNVQLGAVGVTRYIHKACNESQDVSEVDKNEPYTVWLNDECRCTCPTLSTCISYGKRAAQVQPKCLLEFCN
jgi:Leucine-rich repeat (LRR) protein